MKNEKMFDAIMDKYLTPMFNELESKGFHESVNGYVPIKIRS